MTAELIVADVGGTNGRFAVATRDGGRFRLSGQRNFDNAGLESFEQLFGLYLEALGGAAPREACLAIAAPNDGRSGLMPNRGWLVDAAALERRFGFSRVRLVGDFVALAATLPGLEERDSLVLRRAPGMAGAPVSVLGPGTGLGVALVCGSGEARSIIGTEGGHMSFAPATEEEWALRGFIARGHSHVDAERVLSGAGLARIHEFLLEREGARAPRRSAADITAAARAGDELCQRALRLFFSILGGVAGDIALAHGARGGVYLGGGILPGVAALLRGSDFNRRFCAKGPMSGYVEAIPVRLLTADDLALHGAARLYCGIEGRGADADG